MADGLGARCPPSCLFIGARLPNPDIGRAIPYRQPAARQRHEVVAKDPVAHDPLGIRAIVGMEGG
jgi:hypothetical protein